MVDSDPPNGKVFLVGAGPGDPGLITLRGVECLRQADVVLYDYLVNPVITQHAPANAELVCLGKHGGNVRIWNQDEINRELVKLALAGKVVVRLKGGDPAVFARGGEEVAYLARHNVTCEIVPGITAALAAGSHAGISITHRDLASAVALVTGRERPGKEEPDLDFAGLARFPGTLVFYMGVTTVSRWTQGLLTNGMSGETPVALVRRVSRSDQETLRCRLDEVESRLTPRTKFPPPVIAIVGAVADQPQLSNWFEQRPLFGQTILVTRPEQQAAGLGQQLAEQGANVVYQPAVAIEPVATGSSECSAIKSAIDQISSYAWIVFSSTNGVQHFFDRLCAAEKDVRALGAVRIASVGSSTTTALKRFSIQPDVQPQKFDGDTLAAELSGKIKAGDRVLLVRADRGRDVLKQTFAKLGAQVDNVAFYHSRDVTELTGECAALCKADNSPDDTRSAKIDWITVTSSAIARSLVNLFGQDLLATFRLASISPVTTATLNELGLDATIEATEYTMQGLVDAIASHVSDSR